MNIVLAPAAFSNNSLLHRVETEFSRILNSTVDRIDLKIDLNNVFSEERNQYSSTELISAVVTEVRPTDQKIIVLVEVDLFIPIFTFVFGEAQLNGSVSVLSVCRLQEEFYSGRTNENILFERTMKEILHELGHNCGLVHCRNWDCVMHMSSDIEEIDMKGNGYCHACAEFIPGFKSNILSAFINHN